LETNEINTDTTTRRSPPVLRNPTTTAASTTRPSSDNVYTFYFGPNKSDNNSNPRVYYNYYQKSSNTHHIFGNPIPSYYQTNFQASSRNSGSNPEPCGDTRYCDHNCIVRNGIQKCSCNKGYELQHDGKTCLKIDGSRLPPEEIRSFRKRCQRGHFLNDLGECQDIDECRIPNNGCGDKAYCKNKIGSYECVPYDICKTGYRYNEILKTCEGRKISGGKPLGGDFLEPSRLKLLVLF
jgi:hypothetical protein